METFFGVCQKLQQRFGIFVSHTSERSEVTKVPCFCDSIAYALCLKNAANFVALVAESNFLTDVQDQHILKSVIRLQL